LPLLYQHEHMLAFFFFFHGVFAAKMQQILALYKMLVTEGIQIFSHSDIQF